MCPDYDPAILATCTGPRNGGDPITAAYLRFAVRLFLYWYFEAKRGVRRHRRWIMSRDGEAFMVELGIDAQAARHKLRARRKARLVR